MITPLENESTVIELEGINLPLWLWVITSINGLFSLFDIGVARWSRYTASTLGDGVFLVLWLFGPMLVGVILAFVLTIYSGVKLESSQRFKKGQKLRLFFIFLVNLMSIFIILLSVTNIMS